MKQIIVVFFILSFFSCKTTTVAPPVTDSDPLKTDLVLHLPFSGSANDVSGNAIHGTPANTTLVKDRFDRDTQAYSFNGTSSAIIFNDSPILDSLTKDITIAFWMKAVPFSPGGYDAYTLLSKRDYTIPDYPIHFQVHLDVNHILFYAQAGPDPFQRFAPDTNSYSAVADSQWHLIVITHRFNDTTKTSLFIDGVETPGSWIATSSPFLGPAMVGSSYLMIGKQEISGGEWFYDGAIDEVRIYRRMISLLEITTLLTR
ncbi:MAG: LamG domain-containing protein [Bacteroidota bacterium]